MKTGKNRRTAPNQIVIVYFQDLIEKADARHILVSYNNEGILSRDEVMSILSLRGEPHCEYFH